MHPQTFPARTHEAGPPQIREMPRRRGLRHAERFMEVADAHLAASEQRQNPEASRICQSPQGRTHRRELSVFLHIRLDEYSTPGYARDYIRICECTGVDHD